MCAIMCWSVCACCTVERVPVFSIWAMSGQLILMHAHCLVMVGMLLLGQVHARQADVSSLGFPGAILSVHRGLIVTMGIALKELTDLSRT